MTLESTILDLLCSHMAKFSENYPVAYPNTSFEPPDSTYFEVRYLPNTNRNFLIGSDDPTQHIGLLQITVVSPSNTGAIEPQELAGQVVQHFKKGTKLQSHDVIVQIYSKPSVSPSLQDGNRFRVPVSIQYQCFHN